MYRPIRSEQACDAQALVPCVQSETEYLTAAEVAAVLKISPETVSRRFAKRPGVVDLGNPESRFSRRYRILRIPRQALERFIAENRVQ